jgi:hypothetical protein
MPSTKVGKPSSLTRKLQPGAGIARGVQEGGYQRDHPRNWIALISLLIYS